MPSRHRSAAGRRAHRAVARLRWVPTS